MTTSNEERLAAIEQKLDLLEVLLLLAVPVEARALGLEEVAALVGDDPAVQLEVLRDFTLPGTTNVWTLGRTVRPRDYPDLPGLVRAGLRLGLPQDEAALRRQARGAFARRIEGSRTPATKTEAA